MSETEILKRIEDLEKGHKENLGKIMFLGLKTGVDINGAFSGPTTTTAAPNQTSIPFIPARDPQTDLNEKTAIANGANSAETLGESLMKQTAPNCVLKSLRRDKQTEKKYLTLLTAAVNLEIEIDNTSFQLILQNHTNTPSESGENMVYNIL